MKLYLKDTDKFYSIADSAVVSLGRLAAGIALARLAGAQAYGQYVMYIMAAMIILSIPTTLYITPMINLASGMRLSQKLGMLRWSRRRMQRPVLLFLAVSALGIPLGFFLNFSTTSYLGFIVATISLLDLQHARASLQSSFMMKFALVWDLVATAIVIVSVATAYYVFSSPIAGFWWGTAIASTISAHFMRASLYRGIDSSSNVPEEDLQMEARVSGKAMIPGSLANTACSRIHPFVLGGIGGSLVVAEFGASWTLIGPIRMLATAINGMLRPRLANFHKNANSSARNITFIISIAVFALVGLAGIAVGMLAGPAIVAFLFGDEFRSAGWLLPIAIAYGALDSITTAQMIALQATCRNGPAIASKFRIIAATISVGLLVPGCLQAGAYGAYGALIIAEIVYFAMAQLVIQRELFINGRMQVVLRGIINKHVAGS